MYKAILITALLLTFSSLLNAQPPLKKGVIVTTSPRGTKSPLDRISSSAIWQKYNIAKEGLHKLEFIYEKFQSGKVIHSSVLTELRFEKEAVVQSVFDNASGSGKLTLIFPSGSMASAMLLPESNEVMKIIVCNGQTASTAQSAVPMAFIYSEDKVKDDISRYFNQHLVNGILPSDELQKCIKAIKQSPSAYYILHYQTTKLPE